MLSLYLETQLCVVIFNYTLIPGHMTIWQPNMLYAHALRKTKWSVIKPKKMWIWNIFPTLHLKTVSFMCHICYEDFLLPMSNSRACYSRKTYKYYFSAPMKTSSVMILKLSEEQRPEFPGPHPVISTEYRPFTMDVGSAWFSLSLFEKVYHKDKFLSVVRTWETEKLYCFSILFCFVSDSFWLKILCLKVPSVRWSWWSLREV